MLRLAFDFIITWRETRTRPNAYHIAVIPQKATTITIILLFISILYYYGLMIYSQILIN